MCVRLVRESPPAVTVEVLQARRRAYAHTARAIHAGVAGGLRLLGAEATAEIRDVRSDSVLDRLSGIAGDVERLVPRAGVVSLSSPLVPVSVHKVRRRGLQDSRLPDAVVAGDGADGEDRGGNAHGGEDYHVTG
eukprot:765407-Hanusia_phi.AAC.7